MMYRKCILGPDAKARQVIVHAQAMMGTATCIPKYEDAMAVAAEKKGTNDQAPCRVVSCLSMKLGFAF